MSVLDKIKQDRYIKYHDLDKQERLEATKLLAKGIIKQFQDTTYCNVFWLCMREDKK